MINREVCIHLFAASTKICPQAQYNFVHHLVHITPQIQQNVLFGKNCITSKNFLYIYISFFPFQTARSKQPNLLSFEIQLICYFPI